MLYFNDLLAKERIDPIQVNVMLHSPQEKEFAKILPSLIRTRPAALEAYQSSHSRNAENALKKGRAYVASFVKTGDSKLVFAGLYRNMGWTDRRMTEIQQDPEIVFLVETYGLAYGQDVRTAPDAPYAWFDLQPAETMADLQGRLLIGAQLTPTYVRLAENLPAPVLAILEEGVFRCTTT